MGRPLTVRGYKPRLTRSEVADRLGVSKPTVRRLEGVHLFPFVGPDGVHYFDAGRVEELAERVRGESFVGLDPRQRLRAQAICSELGTTLSAWVREQIETRLLSD